MEEQNGSTGASPSPDPADRTPGGSPLRAWVIPREQSAECAHEASATGYPMCNDKGSIMRPHR